MQLRIDNGMGWRLAYHFPLLLSSGGCTFTTQPIKVRITFLPSFPFRLTSYSNLSTPTTIVPSLITVSWYVQTFGQAFSVLSPLHAQHSHHKMCSIFFRREKEEGRRKKELVCDSRHRLEFSPWKLPLLQSNIASNHI